MIEIVSFFIIINILELLYNYFQVKRKNDLGNNFIQNMGWKQKIRRQLAFLATGFSYYYLVVIGFIPSNHIRKFFYKYIFLCRLEKNVVIYNRCEMRAPYNIIIGKGTVVGDCVRFDARNVIELGENVNISSCVQFWTEQHDVNDPYFNCLNAGGKIIVGNRAWISNNVIILPNISIGEGAVIAAGAVVTKDCEPYGIYAGVPAKKIGTRNKKLLYEFDGGHYHFF